jgi:hypothetical protein
VIRFGAGLRFLKNPALPLGHALVISLEEIVFLLHFKKAAAEVIVSNSFIKPSFSIFIFTFVIGFSTIQSYVGS